MEVDEWPCELCAEVHDNGEDALACALADYEDALQGYEWVSAH